MATRDAVARMERSGSRGTVADSVPSPVVGASKVKLGVLEGEGSVPSDFDSVAADRIADVSEGVEDGSPK